MGKRPHYQRLCNQEFGQSVILKNSGAFVDFGLELMLRNKNRQSIGKSTKIGHRYGLEETAWNTQYKNFSGVPSDRLNSFYLQFTVNIPGRRSHRSESSGKN